jgi:hypothetical protein
MKGEIVMATSLLPWSGDTGTNAAPASFTEQIKAPYLGVSTRYAVKQSIGTSPSDLAVTLEDIVTTPNNPARYTQRTRTVRNIYASFPEIPEVERLNNGRGIAISNLFQWVREADSDTDASFVKRLPCGCNITLYFPQSDLITEALMYETLARALSGFFQQRDSSTLSRLVPMSRGSLLPR